MEARSVLKTEVIRFVVVGGTSYLAGLALLYVFTDVLGMHYLVSLLVAMLILSASSWLLNRVWTFRSKDNQVRKEALRYLSANIFTWLLTLGLMAVAVSGLGVHYLVASAFIAFAMAILNFIIHRGWSFRKRSE